VVAAVVRAVVIVPVRADAAAAVLVWTRVATIAAVVTELVSNIRRIGLVAVPILLATTAVTAPSSVWFTRSAVGQLVVPVVRVVRGRPTSMHSLWLV
jgi:hypothetical protein